MRLVPHIAMLVLLFAAGAADAQPITTAGQPARLEVRVAGESRCGLTTSHEREPWD